MCYPFCGRMCSTLLPDDGLLSHPGKTLKRVPVKLQGEMGLDTSSISHPGKTLKRVPVKLQREMGLDTSFISTSDSFTMV
jgi:hypothetical protein